MRLLLDAHHSRHAAERLRRLGHDVIAASDDVALAALPDEDLLRDATSDRRTLVTENVKDFEVIARHWAVQDEHHAGLIFTSPRRFHRGNLAYPQNLVRGLVTLLDDPPPDAEEGDWVVWL